MPDRLLGAFTTTGGAGLTWMLRVVEAEAPELSVTVKVAMKVPALA